MCLGTRSRHVKHCLPYLDTAWTACERNRGSTYNLAERQVCHQPPGGGPSTALAPCDLTILYHTMLKPYLAMPSTQLCCRMFTAVNARAAPEAAGHVSAEAQEKELTDLYLRALGHIKAQEPGTAQVSVCWCSWLSCSTPHS